MTMHSEMQELALEDLPKWSIWPERLLGLKPFDKVVRDHGKIVREYSQDKWQKCADLLAASGGKLTAHDLRMNYHEFTSGDLRPCLIEGKLCLARIAQVMPFYDTLIDNAVRPSLEKTNVLVELGCGPGFIMSMLAQRFPTARFVGGDFAESAVKLAGALYAKTPRISVSKFDFYADSHAVFEQLDGPVTVLTCQALEQIPDCSKSIEALSRYKSKIHQVIHLEPGYDLYDNSLTGLLRKRYIEINDYNRNLVSTLKSRKDVEILECTENVIGWNPFNALARIAWSFKA